MIVDKNFIFIHIPKTGGTWMRQALRLLPTFEHEYAGHRLAIPHGHEHKPVFTIVRNPWDLYVSSYTHFHHNFRKKIHEFDPKARKLESTKFLAERYGGSFRDMLMHIDFFQDFMSKTYERRAGERVLQYENGLASELFKYLDQLNVSIPGATRQRIEQMQGSRFNAHRQHRDSKGYYDEDLEQLVTKGDGFVVDFWGYRCPPELKLTPQN